VIGRQFTGKNQEIGLVVQGDVNSLGVPDGGLVAGDAQPEKPLPPGAARQTEALAVGRALFRLPDLQGMQTSV